MKRVFLFVFAVFVTFCCFLPFCLTSARLLSKGDELPPPLFGRLQDGAVLLDSQTLEPIAELFPTYYVTINSAQDEYYSVVYNNLSGLVEKQYITEETREPVTKFASFYFTAEKDLDTQNPTLMHVLPAWESAVTGEIPYGRQAFVYGTLDGDNKKQNANTLWHYVGFGGNFGYVYDEEGVADVFFANDGRMIEPSAPQTPDEGQTGFKMKTEWLLALALCVPAALIMFGLFSKKRTAARR